MKKLPRDIEELDSRIQEFKRSTAVKHHKRRSQLGIFMEYAFRMVAEFVSPIIIALCIGYMADKFWNTMPIIMLVMLFFGIAAGTLNAYRAAQKLDKDIKE